MADAQFADIEPANSRFYRQSAGKLAEAIEFFNSQDLIGCINLGDLIDRDWMSFDVAFKMLSKSRHKFHHVLGNHDFEVPDAWKLRVPKRLGLRQRYHSFSEEGFSFVVLDTTDVSPYSHAENSKESLAAVGEWKRLAATGAIHAQRWNGAVGERQLAWFDEACRRADRAGRKVIVFAHHPIFPADPHCAWNSDALLQVVVRNPNVVAWINGHNHAGALGVHAEVPFITLKGMVETRDTNAFAVLQLRADRLELIGRGRESKGEFKFRKG